MSRPHDAAPTAQEAREALHGLVNRDGKREWGVGRPERTILDFIDAHDGCEEDKAQLVLTIEEQGTDLEGRDRLIDSVREQLKEFLP